MGKLAMHDLLFKGMDDDSRAQLLRQLQKAVKTGDELIVKKTHLREDMKEFDEIKDKAEKIAKRAKKMKKEDQSELKKAIDDAIADLENVGAKETSPLADLEKSMSDLDKAIGAPPAAPAGGMGGSERPGHKYIRREGQSGNYKYFYKDAQGNEHEGPAPKAEGGYMHPETSHTAEIHKNPDNTFTTHIHPHGADSSFILQSHKTKEDAHKNLSQIGFKEKEQKEEPTFKVGQEINFPGKLKGSVRKVTISAIKPSQIHGEDNSDHNIVVMKTESGEEIFATEGGLKKYNKKEGKPGSASLNNAQEESIIRVNKTHDITDYKVNNIDETGRAFISVKAGKANIQYEVAKDGKVENVRYSRVQRESGEQKPSSPMLEHVKQGTQAHQAAEQTSKKKPVSSEALKVVESMLVNDDTASGKELHEYFTQKLGLSDDEAAYYLSQRSSALKDGINFELGKYSQKRATQEPGQGGEQESAKKTPENPAIRVGTKVRGYKSTGMSLGTIVDVLHSGSQHGKPGHLVYMVKHDGTGAVHKYREEQLEERAGEKPTSGQGGEQAERKPVTEQAEQSPVKIDSHQANEIRWSRKPEAFTDAPQTHARELSPELLEKLKKAPVFEITEFPQNQSPKGAPTKGIYKIKHKGNTYIVDPSGYDYPRYMARLLGEEEKPETEKSLSQTDRVRSGIHSRMFSGMDRDSMIQIAKHKK